VREAEAGDAPRFLDRLRAGEVSAFEELVTTYQHRVFGVAFRMLGNAAEAQEVAQEAFLRAHRGLAQFRGDAKLSTWLARIVANEALMRLRKRTRRSEIVPLQSSTTLENFNEITDPSMEKSPENSAQRAQTRQLLEAQIDVLPDSYRTVFMLRAVEEMSVEETAAVLQIPEATVRSRFFRARSLLREALASKIDLACEEVFAFAGERCDRIVASVMERIGARR